MDAEMIGLIKKTQESILSWTVDSGVYIGDINHPAYGGVHAGYDTKLKKWLFIYNEIIGYTISMLCMLYRMTGQPQYLDRAKASALFLLRHQISKDSGYVAGSFCEGLNFPDLGPMPRCYSFDTAMCIQGLLDLYQITGEKALLEAAEAAGKWLLSMQDLSGFFLSFCDVETSRRGDSGPFFYQDKGCLHAKHAIALLKLHAANGNPKYQIAAEKVCDWVLSLQDSDGAFWANTTHSYVYVHAHCYATEGLFFASEKLKIPAYSNAVTHACDWLDAKIDTRDGILGTHKARNGFRPIEAKTSKHLFKLLRRVFPRQEIATDATIQSARLFLYRYLFNNYAQGLDKAKSIIQAFIPKVLYQGKDSSAKGGLYSRLDISLGLARPSPIIATWGVLFFLSTYLILDAVIKGKRSIVSIDHLF